MSARFTGRLVGEGDPGPIEVSGGVPGVVALHGFGATPAEVELVTRVAASLGLRAHAPLLPGHGTDVHDLARTGWDDWVAAAEAALDRVSPDGEPAIVSGISLGAILAMELAIRHPTRVRGLIGLANAAWLASPFPSLALAVVQRLRLPDFTLPKKHGADIADPEARRTHLTYDAQPVHAALHVKRGGEHVRRRAGAITCPTLLVHGKNDHVCPVGNAARIAERLGSTDKRVVVLDRSWHIVTRDYDKDQVRDECRAFIEALVAEGSD